LNNIVPPSGVEDEFRATVDNISTLNARLLNSTEHCGLLRHDLRKAKQVCQKIKKVGMVAQVLQQHCLEILLSHTEDV